MHPIPTFFYPIYNKSVLSNRKIRIIATSFSDNWKKGFKTYQWLDENLDYDKYDFVFIGRSPCKFKNIKLLGIMNSNEIAEQLRLSDIYITASLNESCSNSLIEALSCAVPSLAINSGGNSEIINSRRGGMLFEDVEDIPVLLVKVLEQYTNICKEINLIGIDNIGDKYMDFLHSYLMKRKREI